MSAFGSSLAATSVAPHDESDTLQLFKEVKKHVVAKIKFERFQFFQLPVGPV